MMSKVSVTLIFALLVFGSTESNPVKRSIVNLVEFVKQAKQICSDMTNDGNILNEELEKKYFDKDGDDTISSDDLGAVLQEHDADMEGYMTKIFDMHDTNKDGKVSMDEYLSKIADADDDNDGQISVKECVSYELWVYTAAGGDK